MIKNLKTIFFFTIVLFFCLIILKTITNQDLNGWYSAAIIYFFSISAAQTALLEKTINSPANFIKIYGLTTAIKLVLAVLFIIIYATNTIKPSPQFFMWFLLLYLFYTTLIGFLFYKRK